LKISLKNSFVIKPLQKISKENKQWLGFYKWKTASKYGAGRARRDVAWQKLLLKIPFAYSATTAV